jgi:uncharacterized membrane protein YdjX (TVP38/TMEM64 family)
MERDVDRLRRRLAGVQVFESTASRRRVVVHGAILVVTFAAVYVLVRREFAFLLSARTLRAYVAGFGPWGPVVLVALQAIQVVVAPVPGQVLAVVAGFLYGAWWGTLYNVVGITIGSTVAFWLARRFGRSYVERVVHDDALARFDGIEDTHARAALFVFFLVPGLPDDVLCFVGGLTRVPLAHLVLIAVVGRAPAFFLANVFGEFLGANRNVEAAVLGAAILAATALGYLNRDRLVDLFGE